MLPFTKNTLQPRQVYCSLQMILLPSKDFLEVYTIL